MELPKTYRGSKMLAVIFFAVMLIPLAIMIPVVWKASAVKLWDMVAEPTVVILPILLFCIFTVPEL